MQTGNTISREGVFIVPELHFRNIYVACLPISEADWVAIMKNEGVLQSFHGRIVGTEFLWYAYHSSIIFFDSQVSVAEVQTLVWTEDISVENAFDARDETGIIPCLERGVLSLKGTNKPEYILCLRELSRKSIEQSLFPNLQGIKNRRVQKHHPWSECIGYPGVFRQLERNLNVASKFPGT